MGFIFTGLTDVAWCQRE